MREITTNIFENDIWINQLICDKLRAQHGAEIDQLGRTPLKDVAPYRPRRTEESYAEPLDAEKPMNIGAQTATQIAVQAMDQIENEQSSPGRDGSLREEYAAIIAGANTSIVNQENISDENPEMSRPDMASVPVRDFLARSRCGVRLLNRAMIDPLFAAWSVRDAVTKLDEFKKLLLKVPGLGQNSVNELTDLFRDINIEESSQPNAHGPARERSHLDLSTIDLDLAAMNLPLDQAVRFHGCGGRLENTLIRGGFDKVQLSQYLDDPGLLKKRLDSLEGVGRKTIDEAVVAIEKFIEAVMASDPAIQVFLASLAVKAAQAAPGMIGLTADETNIKSDNQPARPILAVNPAEARARLEGFIAGLPKKQHHVLVRRYGLEGHARQTLQEVSDEFHVTRERVRQIEAQSLRRLKLPAHHELPQSFLTAHRDEIWALLAGGNDLATDKEVREFHHQLDPLQILAIDAVHGGLIEWLDHEAVRIDTGWLHKSADLSQIDADCIQITQWLTNHPGPRTVAFVRHSLQLSISRMDLAAEHSSEFSIFETYLVEGRADARSRRTIRLHRLATQNFGSQPFDIATLAATFRASHPQDDVASRMFQMQMEEAPHLFCRLFDNIWFALNEAPLEGTHLSAVPFDQDSDFAATFAPGSIGADMAELMAKGPWRHVNLRNHIVEQADGEVAASSIGAILSSNPCFRRVAPAIFDIYHPGQASQDNRILNSVFLNTSQCRAYCQARFSGAPIDWYPAWGTDFELWMTRWARLNAGPELYSSLLAVIEPDIWDAPSDELAYWQRQINEQASWHLTAPRKYELGRRLVEPARMLATLAQLAFFGWTSWVAVNRTTDAKSDLHDSADLLSILIVAGLVEPRMDWQARHGATGKARELFDAARHEMHLNGELSWKSGVLGELFSGLAAATKVLSSSWVDREEFSVALTKWKSGEARTSRAFAPGTYAPVEPDAIFKSDDWDALFVEE